jgi:hypothetical protein
MHQIWTEHLTRWCYFFDPVMLEEVSGRLMRHRRLSQRHLDYLRELKNVGDDLRNFFQLFAVTHRVPRRVQRLVKLIGQLRDQVRLGEFRRASKQARQLLKLMTRSGRIQWPELAVNPAKGRDFLCSRIASMKRLLERRTLTAFDFHNVKKSFRLVYTVYFCLYPKEARLPAKRNALSAVKRLIKKMHQRLLEEKYRRGLKYRTTLVSLPEAFRTHLLSALATITITA